MRPVMIMKTIHDSLGRRMAGLEDAGEGKFHGWGVGYEEFENGPGNYTAGIVERPDGTVEMVVPYLLRFLDGENVKTDASKNSPNHQIFFV